MDFLKDIVDVGRRATVDALQSTNIDGDSPFSPEVTEHERHEFNMPDLFDRFPIVFPWSEPKPVDPALHTVWILDNTAFRTPQHGDDRPNLAGVVSPKKSEPVIIKDDGSKERPRAGDSGSGWEVEFVACYFIKNSGKDIAKKVGHIMHELQIDDSDIATKKRIADRLQPLTDTVLPKRTIRISIAGKEEQTLGPSGYSGISSSLNRLHFDPASAPFQSNALNVPAPFGLSNTTIPADERGWGIISDIDDTIKVTQTPSPTGILHQTFVVETPAVVGGMPELYSHLQTSLQQPPFFYLSASPYNLYPFLRRFRENHYPAGTIILRDASWQNLAGLITSLNKGTKEYKVDRMVKIHSWFPHRRFICIGDSTQQDPEVSNSSRTNSHVLIHDSRMAKYTVASQAGSAPFSFAKFLPSNCRPTLLRR